MSVISAEPVEALREQAIELISSQKIDEAVIFAETNLSVPDCVVLYLTIADHYEAMAANAYNHNIPVNFENILKKTRLQFKRTTCDRDYFLDILEELPELVSHQYAEKSHDDKYTGVSYRYLPLSVQRGILNSILKTAHQMETAQDLGPASLLYLNAAIKAGINSALKKIEESAVTCLIEASKKLPTPSRRALLEQAYYLAPHDSLLLSSVQRLLQPTRPTSTSPKTPPAQLARLFA